MIRIIWLIRGLSYKPFFGSFGFFSYLGKPVFLYGMSKIYIGKKVRIYPNIRLEVHGKDSRIEIQDDTRIAQNVHITSGANLIIGKSTTILANSFITNIDHDYSEIGLNVLDQKMIIRETKIGENCFIGIGAAIQAGTILGKQCIVGANAVVKGSFEDYSVIVGSPGRVIKKYNFETKKWDKTNADGTFLDNNKIVRS